MKIALCNEVLQPWPLERQCRFAADLGYDGLELAPFTLARDPLSITDTEARALARVVRDHGLEISGLHWLLVAPEGLSIVSDDAHLRARTAAAMERLVELCAALGGRYLVHGSPRQRAAPAGMSAEQAWAHAAECLERAARRAQACGVTYCLEPLAPAETDFINTVDEAVRMIDQVGSPALRTMIDCSAAAQAERLPVAELIQHWAPTGQIAHIQVNDPNRRGPGQGALPFASILRSLRSMQSQGHYGEWIAVEPFDYQPDGPASAARAIGYLRGMLEVLSDER